MLLVSALGHMADGPERAHVALVVMSQLLIASRRRRVMSGSCPVHSANWLTPFGSTEPSRKTPCARCVGREIFGKVGRLFDALPDLVVCAAGGMLLGAYLEVKLGSGRMLIHRWPGELLRPLRWGSCLRGNLARSPRASCARCAGPLVEVLHAVRVSTGRSAHWPSSLRHDRSIDRCSTHPRLAVHTALLP